MNKEKLIRRRMLDAEKQHRKGHLERAAELYESVLKIDPGQEAADLGLFRCASGRWPPEQAIREADRLARLFPHAAEAWLFRGQSYSVVQRIPEAEESYRRCIALEPDNYQAIHNLGSLLISFGDRDEGLSLLEQAAAQRPDYGAGHSTLARACYLAGRFEDAIRSAEQADEIMAQSHDLQIAYGDSLYQTRRYSRAREIFSRIVEDTLLSSQMYLMLCPLLRELDGYDHRGRMADADSDYLAATYYRAFLALDQNEEKSPISVADLDKVIGVNPDHGYALSGVASLHKLNKNLPDAITWVEKAITADPENPVFIRQKAFILVDHDSQASLALFDDLIARDPADTRSCLGKAWALKGVGRDEESSAMLKEISEKDPTFIFGLMGSPMGRDPRVQAGTGAPGVSERHSRGRKRQLTPS